MTKPMMLYFENAFGARREIGNPTNETEVFAIISQFLKEHNYKSYYIRYWINPNNSKEKIYDVGSHAEFFVCYNEEGWNEEISPC